jgi:hypothetical protein
MRRQGFFMGPRVVIGLPADKAEGTKAETLKTETLKCAELVATRFYLAD